MIRNQLLLGLFTSALGLFIAGCGGGGPATPSGTTAIQSPSTNTAPQPEASIPFETFSTPLAISGNTQQRLVTVKDADTWARLWSDHVGAAISYRPVPQVDFTQNMVIGVFLSSRSACNNVVVDAVRHRQQPARIEVTFREILPRPDTSCIAMIANPAVLITVPQSSLPIEFVQAPARQHSDTVIRSGWLFGFCLDQCEGEAEITNSGATLRFITNKNAARPERAIWGPVSPQDWEALVASASTLPDAVVGCPDCADEGREWIEVERGGTKKRVVVSCNATIPGAELFQAKVRAIRNRLAVELGLPEVCSPSGVALERIDSAMSTSAIADKRFVTIRDAASWAALWSEHVGGKTLPPTIDFSQKMVVGVFMGRESIACGNTHIKTIQRRTNPDRLEVGYRVVDPGPDVACIATVVNQYSLVVLPASSLPVNFVQLP